MHLLKLYGGVGVGVDTNHHPGVTSHAQVAIAEIQPLPTGVEFQGGVGFGGLIDYLVVVSDEWWNGLPDDIRSELAQILADVSQERNALSHGINMDNRQKVADAGTEIRELSAEQKTAWREAMKPVWGQFEDDIGADLIEAALTFNGAGS